MLVIPVFRRQRQEEWEFKVFIDDTEFKTSLDNIRPCVKTKQSEESI